MKKFLLFLFAIAFLAGCKKNEIPESYTKTKVTICHNGQSISVSSKDLEAHLSHGDVIGECAPKCVPTKLLEGSVAVQNGVDLTNASEPKMLSGAAWTVTLNCDQ
jgi:hypothetical protein